MDIVPILNAQYGGLVMEKIKMTTPLVEMDGDEMTRVLWKLIKEELLLPYVDLNTEYYDLGLVHRNETNDQVTVDSAEATKKYGVAVKCATITPNAARVKEYDLKEMYKSPNGTIRAILDGTVFRAPIIVKGVEPYVKTWKKPITIARHAYGDVYKGSEMKIPAAGKAELVYTDEQGNESRELIHNFKGQELFRVCITLTILLRILQEAALILHLKLSRISGLQLRIQSLRSTIIHLRIYSRIYMIRIMLISSRKQELSISIH